jgi:hypothetical protein
MVDETRGKLVDCCFADDEQEAVSCCVADEQEANVEGTGGYKVVAWLCRRLKSSHIIVGRMI